jgi:DNA-binding MarR family transcriptional regulator
MNNAAFPTGFGYLLYDTSRLLRRRFMERGRAYGLTSSQWRVVAELSRADGLTQVALANQLEIEPMTVSRIVDRLERGGFVERIADLADRRAKLVWLTPKSRAMFDAMRIIAEEVYEDAFEGIDPPERLRLVERLKHINANLSKNFTPVHEEEPA